MLGLNHARSASFLSPSDSPRAPLSRTIFSEGRWPCVQESTQRQISLGALGQACSVTTESSRFSLCWACSETLAQHMMASPALRWQSTGSSARESRMATQPSPSLVGLPKAYFLYFLQYHILVAETLSFYDVVVIQSVWALFWRYNDTSVILLNCWQEALTIFPWWEYSHSHYHLWRRDDNRKITLFFLRNVRSLEGWLASAYRCEVQEASRWS